MPSRPIPVALVACLYLAVGVIGFAAHFHSLLTRQPDAWAIEITELFAALDGLFLFRRQNWARWLAVVWIAFHVGLSAMPPANALRISIHTAFLLFIAWALLRGPASRWFRRKLGEQNA